MRRKVAISSEREREGCLSLNHFNEKGATIYSSLIHDIDMILVDIEYLPTLGRRGSEIRLEVRAPGRVGYLPFGLGLLQRERCDNICRCDIGFVDAIILLDAINECGS